MKLINRFSFYQTILPITFLMVVSSALSSCFRLKEPEFISVENIRFTNPGFTSMTLNADIILFNPNNIGVTLGKTELDIYVNQISIGHLSKDIQLEISRKSKFSVPISLELKTKNLLMTGIESQLRKKTQIKVVGTVRVKKGAIQKNLAVDYTAERELSLFKL